MSDRGLLPGSSAMIDVVVDASVAVKWFIIAPFELHVVTPLLEPAFDIALATDGRYTTASTWRWL